MTEAVVEFAGKQFELIKTLKRGGLKDKLAPLLQEAGFNGRFVVTPTDLRKARSQTQGVLKFIGHIPKGVRCYYHPENESSKNVVFNLTAPNGIPGEIFMSNLIDAQRNILEATARTMKLAMKPAIEVATQMLEISQTMNGHDKTVSRESIFDDQEALSLVESGLRSKASELGSDFLTHKTARKVVVDSLSCSEVEADKVLTELCDGEIITKKGVGNAITYAVPSTKKSLENADDTFAFLSRVPQILDQLKEVQVSIGEKKDKLEEAEKLLARTLANIPKFEANIANFKREIADLEATLATPEAKRAVEMERLLALVTKKS